jgi:hypothetical protein
LQALSRQSIFSEIAPKLDLPAKAQRRLNTKRKIQVTDTKSPNFENDIH